MKIVLLLMLMLFSQSILSASLKPYPVDCFDDDVTCSDSYITLKEISGKLEEVVHIDIFAYLSKEDYENENEIADIFFDFSNWKPAVSRTGTKKVKIKKSVSLDPITENGVLIRRQYLRYKVLGPPPIFYVKARAIGHYWLIDPVQGALLSGIFNHLNSGTHIIEGEDPLVGSEGYTYHAGEFHVSEDNEAFYLHFIAEMIPKIDQLPSVVAHYIKEGYLAILEALYYY